MDIYNLFDMGDGNRVDDKVALIDVSYFSHRIFHGQFKRGERVDLTSMRYTLLMGILHRLKKAGVSTKTHEIIFCFDGRNYWKKVYAPYYKCRRKDRKPDGKDWEGFRKYMGMVQEELRKYYPFKIFQINGINWTNKEDGKIYFNGMEADDVIAILARRFSFEGKEVIIFSGDGDFTQLDYLDDLKIINFEGEELLPEHGCGAFDLIHKIVNGDAKDDIANINMRSNYWETRLEKERQVSAKKLAEKCCEVSDPSEVLNEEQLIRFKENRIVKDFSFIPEDFVNYVNSMYDSYETNDRSEIYNLFFDVRSEGGVIQDNLERIILEMV